MTTPVTAPAYAEPAYANSAKAKTDYPWYLPSIDKHLVPETQKLLEEYSKIPRAEQSAHVHKIREEAWAIRSYPCTGLGVFLVPFISRSPAYPIILKKLKNGEQLLDVGVLMGGDLRRLVFDGAPSDNLYGIDIASHWPVGFALYNDASTFRAHFIEASITTPPLSQPPALVSLLSSFSIISISAVLHQWAYATQLFTAISLVSYIFPAPGSLIVGYQIGNVEGKEVMNKMLGTPLWRHNPQSWERMWEEVGEATGTKWRCESWLRSWEEMGWDPEDQAWMEEGDRVLDFVVTRL